MRNDARDARWMRQVRSRFRHSPFPLCEHQDPGRRRGERCWAERGGTDGDGDGDGGGSGEDGTKRPSPKQHQRSRDCCAEPSFSSSTVDDRTQAPGCLRLLLPRHRRRRRQAKSTSSQIGVTRFLHLGPALPAAMDGLLVECGGRGGDRPFWGEGRLESRSMFDDFDVGGRPSAIQASSAKARPLSPEKQPVAHCNGGRAPVVCVQVQMVGRELGWDRERAAGGGSDWRKEKRLEGT